MNPGDLPGALARAGQRLTMIRAYERTHEGADIWCRSIGRDALGCHLLDRNAADPAVALCGARAKLNHRDEPTDAGTWAVVTDGAVLCHACQLAARGRPYMKEAS